MANLLLPGSRAKVLPSLASASLSRRFVRQIDSVTMREKQQVKPDQSQANESPWSLENRIMRLLWEFSWTLFCVWTPKPLNERRLFWLRLFGAKINGTPFVHQR